MESDWLADRDRARRQRKQQQAKLQLLVLGVFLVAGLVFVWMKYRSIDAIAPLAKPVPEKEARVDEPTVPPVDAVPTSPAKQRTDAPAGSDPKANESQGSPPLPSKLPTPPADDLASPGGPPSEKECRAALAAFLSAPDRVAKRALVIEKPGTEERMKEYYEVRAEKDPDVGSPVDQVLLSIGVQWFSILSFQSKTSPTLLGRASFLRVADGTVRLDWESFVGWSAVEWKVLMESRSKDETTLRAYVSKDDYYNYEFTDSQKFVSFRLRNADGSLAINGFAEKGTAAALAVEARLDEAGAARRVQSDGSVRDWLPMAVKVKFPPGASSDHCVQLTELVDSRWLMLQEPAK